MEAGGIAGGTEILIASSSGISSNAENSSATVSRKKKKIKYVNYPTLNTNKTFRWAPGV